MHQILKNKRFRYFLFMLATVALPVSLLIGQALTPVEFWQRVKLNHPVARQAALLQEQGAQELLYARGGFDPKLYAAQDQKVDAVGVANQYF